MRISRHLAVSALIATVASCGGGGGSPAPTATSDATKAISVSVANESMSAAGEATENALGNLLPAAMVVKETSQTTINSTHECETSGTIGVVGEMEANCTGSETSWSCSSIVSTMALSYVDCARTITIGSTTYVLTMNGTAGAVFSGSGEGNDAGVSGTFIGSFSNGPDVTGDASGSIDLGDFGFNGTLTAEGAADGACTGTATVTSGSAEEVCAISDDCSTCTQ